MAKTVGYACNIKLPWIRKTIQMLEDRLDETDFKQELNNYLAYEIESPTRLRKTREILMNIWYYDSEEITAFRKTALALIAKYPDELMPISVCMLYLTYPVVADVCKYMGRLFEAHDVITNAVLKQKLYDEWGERSTLETTARRVTLTLKDFEILEEAARTRYVLKKTVISDDEIVGFMLAVAMKIDNGSYYSFAELSEFNILFPFEFDISKEYILRDDRFMATHFAGEMTISLKDQA